MTKKVRFIPIGSCGLRVREADGEGQEENRIVDGEPIVFGQRSVNLTPWSKTREVYEVLEPGCITEKLLRESDVIFNINHSTKVTDIFGRHRGTEKDTLKLELKPNHVSSSCDMPETNTAKDTMVLIKRGDITGMSFAFEDDWQDSENGVSYERLEEKTADGKEVWIRHVKRITELYDVSIVTYPAYEQTSVASREQGDAIDKAIDEQIAAAEKREQPNEGQQDKNDGQQREQPNEGQQDKNDGQQQNDNGETEEQKAEREQREREEEQKERERMAAQRRMRQRAHMMRDEEIESLYV